MEFEDKNTNQELAEIIKRCAEKLKAVEPSLEGICQQTVFAADFGHTSGYPGWSNIQENWKERRSNIDQSSEMLYQSFQKLIDSYMKFLSASQSPDLVKAHAESFDTVLLLSKRQVDLSVNASAADPLSELRKHHDNIKSQEQTNLMAWYQNWLKGLIDLFARYAEGKEDVTVLALIEDYLTHFSMPRIAGNDETARRLVLSGMECQQLVANAFTSSGISIIEPVPGKETLNDQLHESTRAVSSFQASISRVVSKGYIKDGIVMKRAVVELAPAGEGSYQPGY